VHLLATSAPSHGAQGFLFIVAVILFVIAAIVAWFTPLLGRAVSFAAAGLAVATLVLAWVQLAAS
jgi:hypothetical protein